MRVSALATTPAATCEPNESMRTVAALMADRGVGSVVVVHHDGVVGIVTDRDIAVRGVARDVSPDAPIERVMTRNVACAPVGTDIANAAETMCRRQVRRLPLVDAYGQVHGVITLDDVVRHMSHQVDDLAALLLSQSAAHG